MTKPFTKTAVALALAAGIAGPGFAATETGNLTVTALVADTCILATGTALSFATIDTANASSQAVPGVVTVTCTATRPSVTVTIGGGDNVSGSQRRMISTGGDFLPYDIFTDSGHSAGIAVDGELYDGGITAAIPQVLTVYGQIPAGNYNAGAYTDTLLVTLEY